MAHRYLYQPFRLGRNMGVAVTDDADRHLTDKLMAVLFTAPGERVNKPEFGVGLSSMLFEAIDEAMLIELEQRVRSGIEYELGDELEIEGFDLLADPIRGELRLVLDYRRRDESRIHSLEVDL